MSDGPSPFEAMRQVSELGDEYWSARDLAELLGYTQWRNFVRAIDKAMMACRQSGQLVAEHFADVSKMIQVGHGGQRAIADFYLSRYACYLVIQNADPSKEIVALGQTYFAVQTHRQEQADELDARSEARKRLETRAELTAQNRELAAAARAAGVIEPRDFGIFQDHGYMGLYNGERSRDIAARKGLRPGQHILDHMNSGELAANLFRAAQTEDKLRREGIRGKDEANQVHRDMGQAVREFILEQGGTLPEDQPTPSDTIAQLEQAHRRELRRQQSPQLGMFGDDDPGE